MTAAPKAPTVNRPCPHCQGLDFAPLATGVDYEYHTCSNLFHYVTCRRCGLAFLNPMPDPAVLDSLYPEAYVSFHFNSGRKRLTYKVREALEWKKARMYKRWTQAKARVLDVGCGDGHYMEVMKSLYPTWEISGIESAGTPFSMAASKGLDLVRGKYEETALGDARYDLMILNQVIEHLTDPDAALRKMHRELRPGGLASLETPSLEGWDAALFRSSYWGAYHFPRHLTLFTRRTLEAFLEKRGFEVVNVRYMLSPVWWVFSLHHLWEAHIGPGAAFFSEKNPAAMALASAVDATQLLFRGKTSNMQVIAQKI